MAKGILVTYSGYPYTPSNFIPDNGLANMAGSLLAAGHKVMILDYNTTDMVGELFPPRLSSRVKPIMDKFFDSNKPPSFFEKIRIAFAHKELDNVQKEVAIKIAIQIKNKADEFGADFIGFKLWSGDGFFGPIAMAEYIKKENPRIKIFGGGPNADLFQEDIYEVTQVFDAVCAGEGENAILGLADYADGKAKLSEIPNIVYKDGASIKKNAIQWIEDLNSLPFPCYDDNIYPGLDSDKKLKFMIIDESRGCPNRCFFCTHPTKSGGRWRHKDSRRIINEIKMMIEKYRIRSFKFAGSFTSAELLRQIADLIMQEKIKIHYTNFGHVRNANIENFKALKESGMYAMFFGMESGNQDILNRMMNKGITVAKIEDVIRKSREAGIFTIVSVIIPSPGDTKKTMKETLDIVLKIKPDSCLVQPAGVFPHTYWAEHPEKFGIRFDRDWVKKAMMYKITPLRPMHLWKPFPYTYDGKKFHQVVNECSRFMKELNRYEIPQVPDDLALMAKHLGMTAGDFSHEVIKASVSGDSEKIRSMVSRINDKATDHEDTHN